MKVEYHLVGSENGSPSGFRERLRMNWKKLVTMMLFMGIVTVAIVFWALCDGSYLGTPIGGVYTQRYWNHSFDDAKKFAWKNILRKFRPNSYGSRNLSFDRIRANPKENGFHITDSDVLVFLHIQKTAGTTFEKFLVRFLDLENACECMYGRKRCKCYRPGSRTDLWLFSRYSTGWSCGLHADYTELVVSNCVDNVLDKKIGRSQKRRYFYTTFLREPVARFISEFRHVQRGATWKNSFHFCGGRIPTPDELPLCFDPSEQKDGWEGVTLDEFLDCPFNLAFNRQTRMLADLNLVGCYNRSIFSKEKRDAIILESAKNNLRNMAYFGLQESMEGSQNLFEATFDLHFKKSLNTSKHKDKSSDTPVSEPQIEKIREANKLDLELYAYAKQLFTERLTWADKKTIQHKTRKTVSVSSFSAALGQKGRVKKLNDSPDIISKKEEWSGPAFSGETRDEFYGLTDAESESNPNDVFNA